MYKRKKTGILGIVVTITILVMLVWLTNSDSSKLYGVENVLSKIILPVQSGITYLKNKVAGDTEFFINMDNLIEQNQKLEEKNSNLEQKLRELEIIQTENETLKQYLNLTKKYESYKTMPAYVINKDISNYSKVIVINIGKKDGIEKGMTVIADQGLVGNVSSVTDNTAKVQTIIDTASAISVIASSTRDSMVCKGTIENKSGLKASYISKEANIIEGDSVETSGMGGIYPKGILVGRVKDVTQGKNKTDITANVETAVNFDKLEAVLVITN